MEGIISKFFNKKIGSGASAHEEFAKELHKPGIKKLMRRIYVRFKNSVWTADLAEMRSFFLRIEMLNTYYV